jgi:hypothetical protein
VPLLVRMPQPRFDFRATARAAEGGYLLTGVPPSRLASLIRRGHLRMIEPVTLVPEGPRTCRLIPLPST